MKTLPQKVLNRLYMRLNHSKVDGTFDFSSKEKQKF